MQETFEQIVSEENTISNVGGTKQASMALGRTVFTKTYSLVVPYKGFSILLENEFGGPNVGKVVCQLPHQQESNQVEIIAKGALFKLFRKKHLLCFSVNTENKDLKVRLEQNSTLFVLSDFIRSCPFLPIIIGKNRDGRYELSTHYHLIFKERTAVVRPLIDFYKQFIDYIILH